MRYQQTVRLKNGEACLIRSGCAADGQAAHDNFNLTHGQTDFLLSYPDENSFDVEQEGQFLAQREADPRAVELCAFFRDRLVGTAGIEAVGKKDKVKYRAEFGISVEKEAWGLGIGRALTAACIQCARQAGYHQLELDVVRENAAAIALYQSFGFLEYGRNPKGFHSRLTGWQELILMRLELV